MENEKKLSQAEIDEIAERVCSRITTNLYQNAGKGLVGLMVRGLLLILVALAIYGLTGTFHLFGK